MMNAAMLNALAHNRAKRATVRITTNGGMTLIAEMSRVMVYPGLNRLFAKWDMRHGLINDTHYNRTIRFADIAKMEII